MQDASSATKRGSSGWTVRCFGRRLRIRVIPITIPEAAEGSTKNGNCNTVKLVTGKPFGITKVGARIMSIITVGGHEVTRNLSEPSDLTIMHIDVYANYLSCISPQPLLEH